MNSFSFSEQDQQKEKHCLGLQIGSQNFGDWRGNSHQHADPEFQVETAVLQEFDINVPHQIPIVTNFVKNTIQISQWTNEPVAFLQKPQQQTLPSKEDEVCETSVQQAQTFYQQNSISTTVCQQSKIQQKWQRETAPALNQFVSLSQHMYQPIISNFKTTLNKTKGFSDKTISNLDMYCLFLSIKFNQEQARLKIMNDSVAKTKKCLESNVLLDGVYLDEKVVLEQVVDDHQKRRQKLQTYCEKLEESCNKVKILLSKTLQNRNKKIQSILEQVERIQRIQQELVQLFTKPLFSINNSWISKSDHRSDRYLQRKYMLQRQTLFLSLLKQTGEKIVSLLHAVFIKQQPVICSILDKQMARYLSLNSQLYGRNEAIQLKNKVSFEQVGNELAEVLGIIIPTEWRESYSQTEQRTCQSIINQLHSYWQNQIFLPTVQISRNLILFQAEARWLSTPSLNQSEDKVSTNNKQNKIGQLQQNTYQNLTSERHVHAPNSKDQSMKVNVVLTLDKYLHFECGQKIASLRLKRLKLSKKGKTGILLSEKQRSITSLFTPSNNLGQLQFREESTVETFIKTVLSVPK